MIFDSFISDLAASFGGSQVPREHHRVDRAHRDAGAHDRLPLRGQPVRWQPPGSGLWEMATSSTTHAFLAFVSLGPLGPHHPHFEMPSRRLELFFFFSSVSVLPSGLLAGPDRRAPRAGRLAGGAGQGEPGILPDAAGEVRHRPSHFPLPNPNSPACLWSSSSKPSHVYFVPPLLTYTIPLRRRRARAV